ncbi:hypothetical protein F8280_12085 [Micromonospora noduli]|uniref:zinc finger domain-containing protein n=1 Tax=Micromonospora noduli TaxID=709876 RepID=UPI00124BB2BB|nr:hypothetical protein [Micromonospora noduli]KAB1925143.1 hypothetical protein F8280_12085 [Micromonospora noduli]
MPTSRLNTYPDSPRLVREAECKHVGRCRLGSYRPRWIAAAITAVIEMPPVTHQNPFSVAVDAVLAEIGPAKSSIDFTCPRCHAGPGEPCTSPLARKARHGHFVRDDIAAREFAKRARTAIDIAEHLIP